MSPVRYLIDRILFTLQRIKLTYVINCQSTYSEFTFVCLTVRFIHTVIMRRRDDVFGLVDQLQNTLLHEPLYEYTSTPQRISRPCDFIPTYKS